MARKKSRKESNAAYTAGSNGYSSGNALRTQTTLDQYSRSSEQYSHKAAKRSKRGKKILIGSLCALLVVLLGCGTAFGLWMNSINEQLNTGGKTVEELEAIDAVLTPRASEEFTEPFYVILIGTDVDDDSEVGRSDTNIVVRVDPTTDTLTMISIPRDTMIEVDGYGTCKFNAAYTYNGVAGTIQEANELLDIEISHYVEVNFETLVELVDAIGGVDLYVDSTINNAAASSYSDSTIVIEEGYQHLDGEAALTYARCRYYVDGDFTRTSHQRTLVEAMITKVMDLSVTELPSVVESAAACVTTDLSLDEIVSLALQFQDVESLTIYSAMVPSTTQTISGISYVINLEEDTVAMIELVEAGEDPSEEEEEEETEEDDSTESAA